jgi:hypothetical protein
MAGLAGVARHVRSKVGTSVSSEQARGHQQSRCRELPWASDGPTNKCQVQPVRIVPGMHCGDSSKGQDDEREQKGCTPTGQ